jgi:hypothetical protein
MRRSRPLPAALSRRGCLEAAVEDMWTGLQEGSPGLPLATQLLIVQRHMVRRLGAATVEAEAPEAGGHGEQGDSGEATPIEAATRKNTTTNLTNFPQ